MNDFLSVADSQMANPVKAKHRATEKRAKKREDAEKELRDQQTLARRWKKSRREAQAALREGPHGKDVRGIEMFIKSMTPSSAPALVSMIERAEWVKQADRETRFRLLTLVADGIAKLREKSGLPPFDDALLFEPPTAFDRIKEILR